MNSPYAVIPASVLALLLTSISAAQQAPSESDVAAGKILFQKSCTACHGGNAQGGRGPDLTSGRWRSGGSDAELTRNIIRGIPGTEMPAFPMSQQEAAQIVAYLRSLGSAAPEKAPAGDSAAGRALFFGSAGCSGCHMFGGRGGRLGPDLSSPAGGGRRPVNLRQAILNPDESQRRNYESVEVRLSNGQLLRGVTKNEDTFSIQIMDEKEQLHMLLKSDLKQIVHPNKSLMPTPHLTAADLENVLAFLGKTPPAGQPAADWKPSADLDASFPRLRNASSEPQNWLTYWGDYRGTHYSRLDSITPSNVRSLAPRWSFQFGAGAVESVPLVVDGLMFVTGPQNNAAALDARTGRPIWRYTRTLPNVAAHCTVMANRGLGDPRRPFVHGDLGFTPGLPGCQDRRRHLGYRCRGLPEGILHHARAARHRRENYHRDHRRRMRTHGLCRCIRRGLRQTTLAASNDRATGDPARSTWPNDKAADTGGGPTWTTGTYDAETDTLFWTTGNPSPDYDGSVRAGANLYTCSVLALDPKTGKRKWYFQFTPHDTHDWDANETPMLVDLPFRGSVRKLLIQANRNAFYYVLDRETGQFLHGKAFAHQTWATGLDDQGHPIVKPGTDPTPDGVYICPDAQGATNFAAPSFDPKTGLFFVSVREACAVYSSRTREPVPGAGYTGTGQRLDEVVGSHGAVRALDPVSGDARWNFPIQEGSSATGVLATAGGLVFAAVADGNLIALEAATGKLLWHYQTGERIKSSPMSFAVDGTQYVAVSSGSVLFAFALPQP